MPGLLALTTPSYNSFRRLQPHFWSSAYTAWGPDNREAAVRLASSGWGGDANGVNAELKAADASSNPYLALGGLLAAGLDGVTRQLLPGDPTLVDPGNYTEAERAARGIRRYPTTLNEALDALEADPLAHGRAGAGAGGCLHCGQAIGIRGFCRARCGFRNQAPYLQILIMTQLNLNQIPIVDHHAHPFLHRAATQDPARFQRWFTESTDPTIHAQHVPNLVVFRTAVRWLAEFLGCAPTVDAILAARAAIPEADYAGHLFRDANIGSVLCDYGYGGPDAYDHAAFSAQVPCPVHKVLRLERLAEELIVAQLDYRDFLDAFDAAMAGARANGIVSLKSIIAYRTGLDITVESPDLAVMGYERLCKVAAEGGRVRLADKALNDQLVLHALIAASTQELPFQFHTGFGDSDADLRWANPLHLRTVIERFPRVPLVLLHAGWPFYRELAHLAGIYPNVWLDLSLAIPFATAGIPAMIRDILGMAPISKVLFATDAYTMPEIYWVAARWGRWGLATALEEFIAAGFMTEAEAYAAAADILGENARRVYGV